MIVVVDSDGLIGILNPQDVHHAKSKEIAKKLDKSKARLLYPASVLIETVTFLQGRLNQPGLAQNIIDLIKGKGVEIEAVDYEILFGAANMMDLTKSKHNTLFDCIVAAVAEKYKADAIFSFDKFYKAKGFKLVSDLV